MSITPSGSYIDNGGGSGGSATTAPTQAVGNNTTLIANTAFYQLSYFRRTIIHATDGSGTVFQNIGEVAPSVTGSVIQAKSFGSGNGPAVNATTNSGSAAQGFTSSANSYKTGKNISCYMTGWINVLTTQRTWFGVTDQSLATMMASDNPAGNYAMFRYSSLGSDASWQCVTKDGTTQTITSSGVVPTGDTLQGFLIIFNDAAGTVTFYINGALVATNSTHLPTTATAVSWMLGSFNTASGSFQNGVGVGQVIVQCDTP